jgi:hypothetical protein
MITMMNEEKLGTTAPSIGYIDVIVYFAPIASSNFDKIPTRK